MARPVVSKVCFMNLRVAKNKTKTQPILLTHFMRTFVFSKILDFIYLFNSTTDKTNLDTIRFIIDSSANA